MRGAVDRRRGVAEYAAGSAPCSIGWSKGEDDGESPETSRGSRRLCDPAAGSGRRERATGPAGDRRSDQLQARRAGPALRAEASADHPLGAEHRDQPRPQQHHGCGSALSRP